MCIPISNARPVPQSKAKDSLFDPRLHADTDKLERFDEAREIADRKSVV